MKRQLSPRASEQHNKTIYECDDCGCIFEVKILSGHTKTENLAPHLIQWAGDVNNCCYCGGTAVSERPFLTSKELKTLSEMVSRRESRP